MTVIVGTTTATAGETILNYLITEVILEEITLSDSGATVGTPLIMTILIRVVLVYVLLGLGTYQCQ